ncbi:FAD-binding oxidoreductase [Gilvimarinus algae]|uniref:FAD-binding oxidoreductase n=1 Tax=Gilvimarinus algae TaxID=3058037 RepID=A0ABT8TH64_9GAMM|nr:FAD-binding oxidoreductase [Gilvimarinus sp. SDUM040014]MDO3382453.1 FAD-binding oxidoreductase [Gilvimarinus sp. SDUM040014]
MKQIIGSICIVLLASSAVAEESWNDVSRLNPTPVDRVIAVQSEQDVAEALASLKPGQKVSISGSRHSQGGHITFPGAVVLDMTDFDQVISVDPDKKVAIVQSGASWEDVQTAANPHGLSVKVMQSSNIFTVGGSLSANVHGRDPRFGPIIETVRTLKIALADGSVIEASRAKNPDLFYSAIGGYGLLGVILEAELELTDNLPLLKTTTPISHASYADQFKQPVDDLNLHFGRCSFAKGASFLADCFSIDYREKSQYPEVSELSLEKGIARNAFFFDLSRKFNWAKHFRWRIQKSFVDNPNKVARIDRNQAMQPPIKFLEYESANDTDILQEYFVPVEMFPSFMEGLENVLVQRDVNLLSMTLRYVPENIESVLSYAQSEMIAVVLYINMELSEAAINQAQSWTRALVDLTLKHRGTYYLTYQGFPTTEQFRQAYPRWLDFLRTKCQYDPTEIFSNHFYHQYLAASYFDVYQSPVSVDIRSLCPLISKTGASPIGSHEGQ